MISVIMYIIFVFTAIAIIYFAKNKIANSYYSDLGDLMRIENNLKELSLKEKQIKEENLRREEDLTRIMRLYEITKDICGFLEEEKIFTNFKNGIAEFLHFEECNYLTHIASQEDSSDYEIIPLISEQENHGYLAIKGLNKDAKQILDIFIAQLVTCLKRGRLYRRVQELSITDSLTKTFTRRYGLERFEEEIRRSNELNLSLSFLMIDIDNFKSFNDKYGHLVGDVILKAVAEIIKSNCREIDLIGRFGGEEFMVILPMTTKDGALFAAERIRKSVESTSIRAFDEFINITVSIGVANFRNDANVAQELIDKADWALYRSKRTGKNKVSVYARYK